jgi:hypothetical protein
MDERVPKPGQIRGGCPCGFWSASNCKHIRATRICDSERVRVGLPVLTEQEHAELDAER